MLHIDLICVGKVKEKYIKAGMAEYLKRLSSYAKISVHEVSDEATKEEMTDLEVEQVLNLEADRIEKKLNKQSKVIVLAIEGELTSSEELAESINQFATYGHSHISFIIGGSLGLAERLKKVSDRSISFGRITLPHQLMRLVLIEQIYRSFRIINGHAYHK
ncbi:23S rRNA (pseudouridine(1915)-N(3))-methyltransferase RlmH [Facklamia miroungae]|uniref:Ribosomal RNA large subunit methyltransferase H n=1 Tax=Facklamia miroungae TaxID=120956 RepID=A0A1G7S1E1_9LACT|nr:23S rRNA (pseudouridine(1915)-N(3))-methyltransferase RlmH [Facklamia miroungae]NKZ29198.1 23S rRNA (pseudouridine(1915)-N(3))-methyltransferase RlmH [Facklamia miroungae]SDG16827.1 23S rRNA (pseudouridine1915-N3)-methyltransferase [Facklamia miroungae]